MTDRELIALCADMLKSAREIIVYTVPQANYTNYTTEVMRRLQLVQGMCIDRLNDIPTLTEEIKIDE